MNENANEQVKKTLIRAIQSGNCIAFVGAGMSMPLAPKWGTLLSDLSERLTPSKKLQLPENSSAFLLEATAQIISDAFKSKSPPGENGLNKALQELFAGYKKKPTEHNVVERRYKNLCELPLKGILTTNFDDLIDGENPTASAFAQLHSHRRPVWFSTPPVLKLHGQINDKDNPPILAREDYRRRVYEGRGDYLALLKALFATHPILFIGTSFTDAYLNELRSEVFSWFARRKGNEISTEGHPGWYAIMPDAEEQRDYYKNYEGIALISYNSENHHQAFDVLLGELHQQLSYTARLQKRFQGKVIVWLDPHPENNKEGLTKLKDANITFYTPRTINDALAKLSEQKAENTILISNFGGESGSSQVEQLVASLHEKKIFVPLVVFGGGHNVAERRILCRRLGALDYTYAWEDCFRVIDELFETPEEHNRRVGLSPS